MKKAVIIGAGTHGQIFLSYFREAGLNIIGFIDDDDNLQKTSVLGVPVLGKFEDLFDNKLKNKISDIYCPIGDNNLRQNYLLKLKKESYNIPSFFHHTVCLGPDVILGEANYLLPGNFIMPHTKIGSYCMINMSSTIGHHNLIGNGVFMSSGTNIGASLSIGDQAYFGIGSTVMTGVKVIGKEALIGAGSVIFKDVPDYAVMAGNPARMIKTNKN